MNPLSPSPNPVTVHIVIEDQCFDIPHTGATHDQKVALYNIAKCIHFGYEPKRWVVGLVQGKRTIMEASNVDPTDNRYDTQFLADIINDQLNPRPDPEGDDYPESEDDC